LFNFFHFIFIGYIIYKNYFDYHINNYIVYPELNEFDVIIGYKTEKTIPTKIQIFLMLYNKIRCNDINKNIIDFI